MNPLTKTLLCLIAALPSAYSAPLILGDTTGNARGAESIDIQTYRSGLPQVTSGDYSISLGIDSLTDGDESISVGLYNLTGGYANSNFGYSNWITSAAVESTALGAGNVVDGVPASLQGGVAVGHSNYVLYNNGGNGIAQYFPSANLSAAFGIYNEVGSGALRSIAVGGGNIIAASDTSVFGANITNSTAGSTMIGPSNAAKVTILSSGNVGIGLGSNSPTEKLEVGGNAKINGTLTTTGAFTPGGAITLAPGQGLVLNNGVNSVSINSPGSSRLQFTVAGNSFEARPGGLMFPAGNKILDQYMGNVLGFGQTQYAVNYVQIENSIAGVAPVIRSVGTDTNIGLTLAPKGTGNINIPTGLVGINTTAAPVDYIHIKTNAALRDGGITLQTYTDNQAKIGFQNAAGTYKWTMGYTGNQDDFRLANSGALHVAPVLTVLSGSGNVGVGTTSPSSKLHVAGPTNTTSFTGTTFLGTVLQGGAGAFTGIDFINNGGTGLGAPKARIAMTEDATGSFLRLGTSNNWTNGITNSAITINPAGNVGIGDTAPTEKLHVVGNLKVTGNIINPMLTGSGTGATSRLLVGGTTSPTSAWQGTSVVGADGQNKIISGYLGSATGGAVIGAHNSALNAWADLNVAGSNLLFRTGETERMRVSSSGFVGIGTTSPATKLHVSSTGSTSERGFKITSTGTGTDSYAEAHFNTDTREYRIGAGGSGTNIGLANKFYVWDATGGAARMVFDTNGNVGIGTTSPGAKLAIQGNGAPVSSTAIPNGLLILSGQGNTNTVLTAGVDNTGGNAHGWLQARHATSGPAYYPIALNPSGGDVGIGTGTTTPAAKLDVNGTVQIAGNVTIKNVGVNKSVIRISPAGDIDMGSFTAGTNPN